MPRCAGTWPGSGRTGRPAPTSSVSPPPSSTARSWHDLGGMNWTLENYDRLAEALGEHVVLVGTSLAISLVIALPLGIWTARRPGLDVAAISVTGLRDTIPALALFALLVPAMQRRMSPAVTPVVPPPQLVLVP